ncbi:hypothetical protein L1987_06792 [Smallanthus sonchifolius]|uniref:Uncharacterized protein n=1 Tax=Smallanthus sonchifolius TaxID=185202 RepID=A0ACB9JZB1_9ASTR|nr:hypothetical protein L1987_06792 [Smallanthus sonchifolius]
MIVEEIEEALPKILKAMKEDKTKNKLAESKNNHHEENHSPNADNSSNNDEEVRKKSKIKKGCAFHAFQGCKTLEYAGNEGAVAALRWLEKTESVISISKCADEAMVLYASNLLKMKHCNGGIRSFKPWVDTRHMPWNGRNSKKWMKGRQGKWPRELRKTRKVILLRKEEISLPKEDLIFLSLNVKSARKGILENASSRKFTVISTGHFKSIFPKLNQAGSSGAKANEGNKKNVRAFVLDTRDATAVPDVVTGHILPMQLMPMILAGFDVVLGMD